jgi:hypothetical protein
MQNVVHCRHLLTRVQIANVALNKLEAAPLLGCHRGARVIEVRRLAADEIIKANDILVQTQQRLDQVRPDEPRRACYQPLCW